MDTLAADTYLFEGFRLDRRGLARRDANGCFAPVPVGSRALEILGVLVQRSGELVFRDEIINAVWPGVVVEDSNLPAQIGALRRVLDNGRTDGSCIQTIPGRGYRFVVPVTQAEAAASFAIDGSGSAGSIAAEGHTPPRSVVCGADDPTPVPPRGTRSWPRGAVMATLTVVAFCLFAATIAAVNWRSRSLWEVRSAPRLSIVVLPFANLSNDPDQQYFADGIADDLTSELSQIPISFVISRNTAFTYRNKPADTKQIGRELGVRYVLEGSVQRSGSHVRVNAQLIDAETDALLWAEQFDRDAADLFALQDDITSQIAVALKFELIAGEAARPTGHPDALDFIFRGRATLAKPPTRDSYAEAIRHFEGALALGPGFVEAQIQLADSLSSRALDGMADRAADDVTRAEELIGQALAASPRSTFAHHVKGNLLRWRDRCEAAIPEYETALAFNHNAVGTRLGLARCKLLTGSIGETIPLVKQAIRLSPRSPYIAVYYFQIAFVHLLEGRVDEAIAWLEKARIANPAHPAPHACLASAYALNGEIERAAAELTEARRLSGGDRYSSLERLRAVTYWGVPKIRALVEATYFTGLRKAGMPEQ
jgi:TolB-like protein/DNA-binding winged helix-turn-helix (wHTH) protein